MKKDSTDLSETASDFAIFLADAVAKTGRPAPVIVPGERVSLLAAALPIRGTRARRAALPFALEDRISGPLEEVHVALCRTQTNDNQVLAAVVDRALMVSAKTDNDRAVLPETFALTTPDKIDGALVWAIWSRQGRALVRCSDGTGFIVQTAMLPMIWTQASRPAVISYGDPLEGGVLAVSHEATPPPPDARDMDVDLRQGDFKPASTDWVRYVRRAAVIVAIGLVGHLGLSIADTVALTRIAERERATAQAALNAVLPGVQVTGQVELILSRLAPSAPALTGSSFLPLLDQVSLALLEASNPTTFSRLSFAANPARLTLLLEVPTLDDLQEAERLLRGEGLRVETGAATASTGVAQAEFVVSLGDVQ